VKNDGKPPAMHLMQAMLPALERPHEVSSLYLDSMFLAARDHIASAYGTFKTEISDYKCGLTARQLRHALEYIEANLSENVRLADVAIASAASVSSLTRGFKASLGVSPHNWLLNRRIALAPRLISKVRTEPLGPLRAGSHAPISGVNAGSKSLLGRNLLKEFAELFPFGSGQRGA
jgi:AraC-like DNA-binding protein